MERPIIVVVPARDEARAVGDCLAALAAQRPRPGVVLVDDGSTDGTPAVARAVARELGLPLDVLVTAPRGVGRARRVGMDVAADRLPDHGVLACTDADTAVAPDWIARQLAAIEAGADAVAGDVAVDGRRLAPGVLDARAAAAVERFATVRRRDPDAEHHHFAGASIALTVAAYRRVGGIPPLDHDEDAALERALVAAGLRVVRRRDVRVVTSGRLDGRAPAGLARDLRSWSDGVLGQRPDVLAGAADPRRAAPLP